MIIELETGTVVTIILTGMGAQVALMKLIVDGAVSKLGKIIAEKYATKEDLTNHVDTWHKD